MRFRAAVLSAVVAFETFASVQPLAGAALGAASPTISAEPSRYLEDGERVVVSGAGLPPNSSVRLGECAAQALLAACLFTTGPTKSVVPDANGRFLASFRFRRFVPANESPSPNRPDLTPVDCAVPSACVLKASAVDPSGEVVLEAPIQFDPGHPARPAPALTVTPTSSLRDWQRVDVVLSGFLPQEPLTVFQCVNVPGPFPGEQCIGGGFESGVADAFGGLALNMEVRRIVSAPGPSPVDCALAACYIGVGTALERVRVPVAFDSAVPVPPPPPQTAATPVTGLGDRDAVTVEGQGFPPRAPIRVKQCLAGLPDSLCFREIGAVDITADAGGAFTAVVGPRRRILDANFNLVDCAASPGACVLRVDDKDISSIASEPVPLTFDENRPSPPPASIVIDPNVDLPAHPTVTVTGSGFGPGDWVVLDQCDTVGRCRFDGEVKADDRGAFRGEVTLGRIVNDHVGDGRGTADCATVAGGCMFRASPLGDITTRPSMLLDFDPAQPLAGPVSVTLEPHKGFFDDQRVRVRSSGLDRGRSVGLYQCAADGGPFDCDVDGSWSPVADAQGVLDATVAIHKVVITRDRTVDCGQLGACVLRLFGGELDIFGETPTKFHRFSAVTAAPVTVTEADVDRIARVVVSLSKPSTRTIAVDYSTADDTAVAPLDYLSRSGSVVFAPGQTEKRIWIVIRGDDSLEGIEAFVVHLSGFVHARSEVPLNAVTVSVVDDD